MPSKVIRFIEESVQAPDAMITSRIATFSDSPPHEPTRMIEATSYSRNSSLT